METFGRYRLLKQIASGGMGEIFLARSASLDGFEKDLVIKRILPVHGANERFVSMFLDEARVTMSLSHQNVVQVFDFGETDGRYYIAMEHVHGCDLRTVMRLPEIAGHGLPPGLALWIMREVTRGLDYAHNKKSREGAPLHLVHRDVSPENVLLSLDGGVKLTDFGIARAAGQGTILAPGMIVGKVHYMAPEIANAHVPDLRSDIFACGAVLWELLVGRRLYEQGKDEPNEVFFERVRTCQVEKPSAVNRDVSRKIEKIVLKALSLRPEDRHASARELGEELHEQLITKYRDADNYALESFLLRRKPDLKIVGFEDIPPEASISSSGSAPTVAQSDDAPKEETVDEDTGAAASTEVELDAELPLDEGQLEPVPELRELAAQFKARPSVWLLIQMGDASAAAGQVANALACYRVAAVKFAQHGLLAQSLLCAKLMLEQDGSREVLQEIATLPTLVGRSDTRILPYYFRSGGRVEEALAELIAEARSARQVPAEPPPLLAHLGKEGFAQLARLAPLERFESEQRVVEQGQQGDTMYLILAGRVLVHVDKPSGGRVNVAALAAGDVFGESSFFSRAPRNATVEAVEDTSLIEIGPELYEKVMSGNPKASALLLRFYKERILDRRFATSPTFGLLGQTERRELLQLLSLRSFEPGFRLSTPGAPVRALVLIKRGTAEVVEQGKVLGAGTILGDPESLTGALAEHTVVAGEGGLEAFVLRGTDLKALVERREGRLDAWLAAAKPRAHAEVGRRSAPPAASPLAGRS